MSEDIFGYKRNPKPAAVLTTEDSILVIGGSNAAGGGQANTGFLVQSWNIEYNQQVEEIFELGSSNVYWKKGRPTGQGTIGRIVGGTNGAAAKTFFPKDAFDACLRGATMQFIGGGSSCGTTSPVKFTMSGVLVAGLGYQSQVQDAQVNENITWRFSQLQIS
jgi:hypothetical protein